MTEKELDDILGRLESKIKAKKVDEARDLAKEAEKGIEELKNSGKNIDDYQSKLNKLNKNLTGAFADLKKEGEETESIFDKVFGEFKVGLDANAEGIGSLSEESEKLLNVWSNFGSNIAFWRDYDRRIRETAVSYGLTENRVEEFRASNTELEKQFIQLGGSAEELKRGISGLYDTTERTDQINKDFVDTLGGITLAFGVSAVEAGKYIGTFKNLNISYAETGKILNDVRNAAVAAGLNTKKVLDVFTDKFRDLNSYSFKNGVQGMTEMVKQSVALKINMDRVLALSDDFTDPEKTMEFASNMQMLGGSFAQLGDFNKLMYDAAVAPEELAKNIAKASASMGSFNKETGRLDISFAERMQLDQAAKQLGMSRKEMMDMATAAAKINDMKMSLNFKPLSEDAYSALSTLSEFDPSRGEYVVKFKDEKGEEVVKSIAELSDEDIKKISERKDTESLKSLATQKFDAIDTTVTNMKVLAYDAPNVFKAMGGLDGGLKESIKGFEGSIVDLAKSLKKDVFEVGEEKIGKFVSGELKGVLDGLTSTIKENFTPLVKLLVEKGKQVVTAISEGETQTQTKSMGDILYGEKYSEGNILKGLTHEEGGIPFTVNGKTGFEAEGGEVLLTKGVSKDPNLLSAASEINEAAGGKKLFDSGGVIDRYADGGKIPSVSNYDYKNVSQIFENINNTTQIQKTINNETFEKLNNTFIPLYENFNEHFEKINETNNKIIEVLNKLNSPAIGQKENNFTELNKGKVINNVKTDEQLSVIELTIKKLNELNNFTQEKILEQKTTEKNITNVKTFDPNEYLSSLNDFSKFKEKIIEVSSLSKSEGFSMGQIKKEFESSFEPFKKFNVFSQIDKDEKNITPDSLRNKEMMDYILGKQEKNLNVSNLNKIEIPTNVSNLKPNLTQNVTNNTEQLSTLINSVKNVEPMQGGLTKNRDLSLSNISVNGSVNVVGNLSFSPIKVTLEGSNLSKEITTSQETQEKMLNEISKTIKENMSKSAIYTQLLTNRTAGLNEGKGVSMPGITTDIS